MRHELSLEKQLSISMYYSIAINETNTWLDLIVEEGTMQQFISINGSLSYG
jgi:hypothetical protein